MYLRDSKFGIWVLETVKNLYYLTITLLDAFIVLGSLVEDEVCDFEPFYKMALNISKVLLHVRPSLESWRHFKFCMRKEK